MRTVDMSLYSYYFFSVCVAKRAHVPMCDEVSICKSFSSKPVKTFFIGSYHGYCIRQKYDSFKHIHQNKLQTTEKSGKSQKKMTCDFTYNHVWAIGISACKTISTRFKNFVDVRKR